MGFLHVKTSAFLHIKWVSYFIPSVRAEDQLLGV